MDPKEYVGKHVLLGINHREAGGEITSRTQIHGTVLRVSEQGWLVLERADGRGEMEFPPQLQPAKKGEYVLASTGEVVVDPDYLAVFTVELRPPPAIQRG